MIGLHHLHGKNLTEQCASSSVLPIAKSTCVGSVTLVCRLNRKRVRSPDFDVKRYTGDYGWG
ncbi:hypothetical protein KKA00_05305 [bacterium]|nr:hypothetical protein [bacterium]